MIKIPEDSVRRMIRTRVTSGQKIKRKREEK